MGLLQNGKWVDQWYDTKSTGGRFERKAAQFRNWITKDGTAGPTGVAGFNAEPGRYHLYVSLACPWAHRTMIFRALKGLESMISVSVVHWYMVESGWTFDAAEGVVPDTVNDAQLLHQIYTKANSDFSGRVTVPVLWDKKNKTIVSNESSEIIRMFNSEFDKFGATVADYYPEGLRQEIDAFNDRIYPVYVGHFKCNIRRIIDYPNLWNYLLDLYQQPGIADTVNMEHIKNHYYASHETINPSRIVPKGPKLNYNQTHNREKIG
jgi:putative glutathione S-transferase